MKKHFILLFLALMGTFVSATAASRTVQGVVLSAEDNLPLIGATVYVAADDLKKAGNFSSTTGVITDMDGKFTISIPDGITRFFCSYVGYDALEVKLVTGKHSYAVTLHPSAHMLDAVVVTGYQTVERRKLTAAVSKIDISDQMVGAAKNIDQALSGQIAGLSVSPTSGAPGAPAKIRIRGTSSLNGTQDPLWVLDGIPLEGTNIPAMEVLKDIDNLQQSSIAGLNPSDIDNITVLKDAAATAIYGARAANGVIVITTKSGKSGKPVVSFSTKLTYSPAQGIDRLNLMNSSEKVGLELDLLQSGYPYRSGKGEVSRIISGYGLTGAFEQNGWSALSSDAQRDINRLRDTHTDWNDILFRDAFAQEYNVSLSGGSEKATYYTSLAYMKDNGNIPNVGTDRLNMVLKTNYKVNRMLKVGASLFANRRTSTTYLPDNDGLTNPVFYSRLASPYFRPYDEQGNYLYDIDIENDLDMDFGFNPFEERNNTSNETTINGLSAILDAELRFDDRFKLITQLGLQLDQTSMERIADGESYAMRLEKKNRRYNGVTYLPVGGYHKANENSNSQITWKAMGEYRDSYNDIHEFEAMVGTELRKTWNETLYTVGYGFDRKTLTTKPILFPEESKAFPLHTKGYTENAYVSAFSTLSYSLLNRYTLGGSIRFDGSDLFGVDKKYRYLPLYSVSGLWRASNEPFMQEAKWIDNLVFRASYGLQGNIDKNTSPFLLGTYRVENILPGGSEDMIDISGAPNDKLRWEKTHSVNAGFDFSILNQAINLSADYYYRKGVDLIGIQMLPLETGFVSTNINWASMRNQGVELGLTTRNIHTKRFMWTTNFNFAYNQNTVLKETMREDATYPGRQGYPVGAIFALKTAGLDDQGYPMFLNKEGEAVSGIEFFKLQEWGFGSNDLTPQDWRELYTYMGTSDCPYTGGFNNTFTYKAFELGVNFSFDFGGKVRTKPSYSMVDYDRGRNSNRDILNRWTPENTNTNYPALLSQFERLDEYMFYSNQDYVYNYMDIWVKDLNYVRMQNIRLGYTLPNTVSRLFGLSSATVAVEGRNLVVFGSSYTNFLDPETMGNPYAMAIPKSVTFSLSLNF
ncbi:MAG: SusC/RagA family TonB-linked outer membrane protein [Bacteroides sp.]|uniref:SusC/RagA family TonB-linked outer membrane protein n=1 Tax=Bacteroides sp. TaxID=29523 RepID=UPI001B6BECE7|nr:SusC/RagA family TonB-linked outer membrane protein [Bacteroides sp.]MBP6067974.1 SusC/RagA family TonB-linked outer membrane protein [Bacteroides sp.]MBP9586055.1 SusC/RagA family TonB-linked outer membrane protein [Bacteroides sp.]